MSLKRLYELSKLFQSKNVDDIETELERFK